MSNRQDHRTLVPDWFCFTVSDKESYSFERKQLIELPEGFRLTTEQFGIQVIDRFIIFTAPNGRQALYNKHQRDGSIYADEQRDKEEERDRRAITADIEPANDNECLEVIEDEYSYRDSCFISSHWRRKNV